MNWKNFEFVLILNVMVGFVCLVGVKEAAAKRRTPYYWVKKVNLEANILFDDQTLAKVVDLGKGIKMTPGVMGLLVDEVEGFYSSHGHFLVKVKIPRKTPKKGVLKLKVFEIADIMEGNGEEERAKRAVEKLIKMASLQVDEEMKVEVIEKLVEGYRKIRFEKVEVKKQRLAEVAPQEAEAQKTVEESKKQKQITQLDQKKALQKTEPIPKEIINEVGGK